MLSPINSLLLVSFITLAIACTSDESHVSETTEQPTADNSEIVVQPDSAHYIVPVKYKDWEIGNPENVNTILKLYQSWDATDTASFSELFADTVELRIPTERTPIDIPGNKMASVLRDNWSQYKSTSNEIISAISVKEKKLDQEWVMITAYAKWVEKNGKKDSLLYHDDWHMKNGKAHVLLSFQKVPIKNFTY